jgi:hypothetical protein
VIKNTFLNWLIGVVVATIKRELSSMVKGGAFSVVREDCLGVYFGFGSQW